MSLPIGVVGVVTGGDEPDHLTSHARSFLCPSPRSWLQRLSVRALPPHEHAWPGQRLQREHYLGDVPQGRQFLQVVAFNGQAVALLDWVRATWKLADREEWMGWTPSNEPSDWPWWYSTAASGFCAQPGGPSRPPGRWRWRAGPCLNTGSRPTATDRSWPRPAYGWWVSVPRAHAPPSQAQSFFTRNRTKNPETTDSRGWTRTSGRELQSPSRFAATAWCPYYNHAVLCFLGKESVAVVAARASFPGLAALPASTGEPSGCRGRTGMSALRPPLRSVSIRVDPWFPSFQPVAAPPRRAHRCSSVVDVRPPGSPTPARPGTTCRGTVRAPPSAGESARVSPSTDGPRRLAAFVRSPARGVRPRTVS